MGSLLFLMKHRDEPSDGPGQARRERAFVWASGAFVALFALLFIVGLSFGLYDDRETGKSVVMASFGSLVPAAGLYWYRNPSPERRYVVRWTTFIGSHAVLAAMLCTGIVLVASLDLTGPWIALGVVAALAMLAMAALVASVLRAKFDPRLSDGTDPYA